MIVKLDLGLASSWLFPSINFQFRTETFLSIFLGCQEWPARFWEVQAVGNVVKISIQQRWESENEHPRKPLQNHRYADLWAKRPKEMVTISRLKEIGGRQNWKWGVRGFSPGKNYRGYNPWNLILRLYLTAQRTVEDCSQLGWYLLLSWHWRRKTRFGFRISRFTCRLRLTSL